MRRHPNNPAAFLRALRRRDFKAFLKRAWPHISGGKLIEWNWHIEALAFQLGRVAKGKSRRLLISLPPRNAKTKTVSVIWVAWMLGQNPGQNFVCVSYSNELSGKFARDCLSILLADWYRELFPNTIISAKRSASLDFETTLGGGRLATSVTGTLTGRGGDIIILDDLIKPEEANSDTVRTFVNDWFKSTLAPRLNDKANGAILCVMQRLHQYDLPGMLLDAGGWDNLSLAAIAQEDVAIPLGRDRVHHRRVGDVLHPARESLATLEQRRTDMGSSAFNSQYLQAPLPAVGNLVRAVWLKHYPASLDIETLPGRVVQSWDTASKDGVQSDWSVCVTAVCHRGQIHIINVYRERLTIHGLVEQATNLARQYRAQDLLIEDAASGIQLMQLLRNDKPAGVPWPIACRPEGDKVTRMAGAAARIEAGQLVLPQDAHWLAAFKSELLAFPSGRYDDQVDALSQLINWHTRWIDNADYDLSGGIEIVDASNPRPEPDNCTEAWLYNLFD